MFAYVYALSKTENTCLIHFHFHLSLKLTSSLLTGNHENILFPTWHRAYLLRFENALRKIPNCENVTLPFWDEMFSLGAVGGKVVPEIITTPKYFLDNKWVDNPLYSYRLQQELLEQVSGSHGRYTKHVGYETVRYPLSGLVGTDADREATA